MTVQPHIELVNELAYSFGSSDNKRQYQNEYSLDPENRPNSIHGLLVDGEAIVVVGASSGATGIHERSLVRVEQNVYFAVGPHVCRLSLGSACLDWHLRIDEATCFGVHHSEMNDALISHGELAISRFTPDGRIAWQCHGRDIFTGETRLHPDHVEAIDFDGKLYRFPY